MPSYAALAVLAFSAVTQVAAHGGVLSYSWDGDWYWGWQPYNSPDGQTTIQRPWSTYNPILDPLDPTIACNDDGSSGALQLTGTVSAGTDITAYWNPWPHNTGPVLTYLAQCPGTTCTGVNASTLQWFKIEEAGLVSGTIGSGTWAAGVMIDNNSTWTTTIPKSVPSGSYLIRFETIALHLLPAQFYPECAQIDITDGGDLAPTVAELVTFPGGYSSTDPGLTVDIYSQEAQTDTTYIIPGPPLYAGAAGSTTTTVIGTTSTTTSTTVGLTSASTTTTTSSTSSSSGAAEFAQCGGAGWTGPTTCVAPYTCTALNDYYSQCL